jgi:hypothetical protein
MIPCERCQESGLLATALECPDCGGQGYLPDPEPTEIPQLP